MKDFSSLLSHAGSVSSHDFVGCMRSVEVDDRDVMTVTPTAETLTETTCQRSGGSLCSADTCTNGATCVDEWHSYRCRCLPGFTGEHCDKGKINVVVDIQRML